MSYNIIRTTSKVCLDDLQYSASTASDNVVASLTRRIIVTVRHQLHQRSSDNSHRSTSTASALVG